MNDTPSGASGEDVLYTDRVLASMEEDLLSTHPGTAAMNLGLKLSELIDSNGHLKDPRAVCSRIHDWYTKRGGQMRGMIMQEYGRRTGTEIWTGALCKPQT
jgi:hypothetical protein